MTRAELGKTLNLETDWIPEGRRNRTGLTLKPDFITIHNTGNANVGADAKMHARWVRDTGFYVSKKTGKRSYVSWHYTVDDKRVIRHLPITERGIHAGGGDGNRRSIAIEICMNKGIDQQEAFARAARLVAALRHDLSIPDDNVVPHHHWSGKECPVLLLNGGKPGAKWRAFKQQVQDELDGIG